MFTSLYASGYSLIGDLSGTAIITILALANMALFYTYLLAESVRAHHLKGLRYAYCYNAFAADIAESRKQIEHDGKFSATAALVTLFTLIVSVAFGFCTVAARYSTLLPSWALPAAIGMLALACAIAAHHFAVSSRDYIVATWADDEIPWSDLDTGYWARMHRNAYYLTAASTAYLAFWAAYGGYYVLR